MVLPSMATSKSASLLLTFSVGEPDGYTILLTTTGPAAINRLIYKNLQYNPARDLMPIGLVTKSPLVIVATLNAPFRDVKGLLDYARAHPGKLNVGIPGKGTIGHLTSELLQMKAGVKPHQAVRQSNDGRAITGHDRAPVRDAGAHS